MVKVDVDANPGLSRAFNIMSIPTIAFFKPGAQPQGVVGFRPMEQLEAQFGLAAVVNRPRQAGAQRGRTAGLSPGATPRATARAPRRRLSSRRRARRSRDHAVARSTAWPSSSTGRSVTQP